MHNILSLILETRRKKIEILKKNQKELISLLKKVPKTRSLKEAIKKEGKISLIAELKKASPSSGILRHDFSPVEIAKIFEKCKVSAISILTEEEFFLGKISYIEEVRNKVSLPILRKDFILDEIQVLESRVIGADAILLIAKILDPKKLKELYSFSKELEMDVLVEVHTYRELERAVDLGVEIIGINNRNLNNLKVDINTTVKLAQYLPKEIVKVSESGINSREDIVLLKDLGIDAVLVGEAIMKAKNIEEKLKELNIDY